MPVAGPGEETRSLVRRAREGSRGAADELYRRVASKLHALIRLRLGPALRARVESRDVLQVVLARSWERLGQFRGDERGSLMAWLARMAENEIRDLADRHGRLRRDAALEVALDDPARPLDGAARSALSQAVLTEEAARVERAMEALPAEARELIVLRRLEELSWAEVGERLGRSPDSCRVAYARAMASLVRRLEPSP